jgi:hypothetical protein
MNRHERRRAARAKRHQKLIERDDCALCHVRFAHMGAIYTGTTPDDEAVMVGECCVEKLKAIDGIGFNVDYEGLAVDAAKRAGITTPLRMIPDNAWKEDDAAWFRNNPGRLHHVRLPYPGEISARGLAVLAVSNKPLDACPPEHECQVLLRQIEPGMRVSLVLGGSFGTPIPDDESVVHAIFDLLMRKAKSGGVMISREELVEMLLSYAGAGDGHH